MPGKVPVSCVITNFNGRGLIEGAIASVLRQSVEVAEIIVADDASTDGSQKWLQAVAERYPQVRPVLRQANVGVAANRDLAMREANQPFVTHFDGDDLIGPGKIESEWDALEEREDAVAFSRIAWLHLVRPWRSSVLDPAPTVAGSAPDAVGRLVARHGPIPRDMLMSKSLYEKAGGLEHGLNLYEDWQFKLRLAAAAPTWCPTREIGTLYMQRGESLSKVRRERLAEAQAQVALSQLDMLLDCLGEDRLGRMLTARFGPGLEGIVPAERRSAVLDRFPGFADAVPAQPEAIRRRRNKLSLLSALPLIAKGTAARRAAAGLLPPWSD